MNGEDSRVSRSYNYSYIQNKWHPDNIKHRRKMTTHMKDTLQPLLPVDKNIHILDFGCGLGYASGALQDMGYSHLTGIDVDRNLVQSWLDIKLPALHTPDSSEFLKHTTESHDVILALDVIEHITQDDQIDYIKLFYKSLRPEGSFICTVPNANSAVAVRQRYADWTHRIIFTEHSLNFLLHHGGFRDFTIRGAGSPTKPTLSRIFRRNTLRWLMSMGFHAFRRLEMIAELGWSEVKHSPLSVNLLAIARKSP